MQLREAACKRMFLIMGNSSYSFSLEFTSVLFDMLIIMLVYD